VIEHREPEFKLTVLAESGPFDSDRENVDVEVETPDGHRYSATFATLSNIERILEKSEGTDEFGGGRYFWCRDLVIVRDVSFQSILDAVRLMVRGAVLDEVLVRLDDE